MILRAASMKELVARRDELRTQAAAIDDEIARRARETMTQQQRDRAQWYASSQCSNAVSSARR